ncbi:hypothetical protein BZG25_06560 [Salinivibrio sp. ML198]|uniref:O-antigen ligase family protein n=1 Tax=unclassified Salinivibrio TaxID=2636825 RepID=UPI0009C85B42|nr:MULTISPECIES: O-antigen ligase family protein [unclassified Salinivibrio]OOE68156.1 hypothetical protein BZG20_04285 [Salinivibrio sp. IB868]OOE75438.1 hypothetical protein BZG22_06375 [Salinivibrio sp. IB870]OOE80446.1 hypothetical protein BZG25_06560 [Salinivibrio sp. ML198]
MSSISMASSSSRYLSHQLYYQITRFFLFGYALCAIAFPDVGEVFRAGFLLLSLPLLYIHWPQLKKDPIVWAFFGVIIVQCLSWANSLMHIPDIANAYPHVDRLAKLFLLVPIGLALQGRKDTVIGLAACFVLGVFIACYTQSDFSNQIQQLLHTHRVDFGLKNAQYTSMLGGVIAIISAFSFYLVDKSRWTLRAFFALSAILGLVLTLVSQSRQVWLALAIVIALTPILLFFVGVIEGKKKLLLGYAFVVITLFAVSQSDYIQNRALKESAVISSVIQGNLDNIPMTSVGVRLNSWLAAWDVFQNTAFVGLGENGIGYVISSSDKLSELKKTVPMYSNLSHLHSNHVETLVAYGLAGFALILFTYFQLATRCFVARDTSKSGKIVAFFSIAFFIYWLTVNAFETFNSRSLGVFAFVIVSGCFYSLANIKNNTQDER